MLTVTAIYIFKLCVAFHGGNLQDTKKKQLKQENEIKIVGVIAMLHLIVICDNITES